MRITEIESQPKLDRSHEQAEFLSTRRNQIVEMNDNGVLTAAPDGTVSYYLPDLDSDQDPATWDTAANIDLYNTQAAATAQAQAEELKGRTCMAEK